MNKNINEMNYGPSLESSELALRWLSKNNNKFGHFINGKMTTPINTFETINPANSDILANISKGSFSDVNSAINIDKEFIEVYYQKAQIMLKMRNVDGAISTYTSLIEILPNNPMAYYNRGLIKYRNGDKKGACEDAALSKSKNTACEINLYDPLKQLIENSCDEKQKEVLLSDKQDKDCLLYTSPSQRD